MSPNRIHADQSRNTLMFGSHAKDVTTNAKVNFAWMPNKALVKQPQREMGGMQSELERLAPNFITDNVVSIMKEKDLKIQKVRWDEYLEFSLD